MKIRRLGYLLLILGISVAIFSLISDSLGIGKKGIQAAQMLLIQLGVFLSVISFGLVGMKEEEIRFTSGIKRMFSQLTEIPASVWVIAAFFIAYLLLFIVPVFLNPERAIQYQTAYIPEIRPIGRDLGFNTGSIKNWLDGNGLYDIENHYYPPLYAVIFSPFLLIKYPDTYYVMTAVTLVCTIVSGLFIPHTVIKNTDRAIPIFFFVTTIFSYGMQFELERGQFNVFAFTLSLLAVYIFHRHYTFRHLAYLLISIAAQIKLYPAIFMILLIKDWRDWKGNILRFAGLGIFNLALLFVLGPKAFFDFLGALPALMGAVWVRPYNHSLVAFINELTRTSLGLPNSEALSMLIDNASLLKLGLALIYVVCFLTVVIRSYVNRDRGINVDLLVICTIGTLILPSVSIDYKLPMLAPALALTLSYPSSSVTGGRGVLKVFLIAAISLAYSFTLFSFVYRPIWLGNSFPLFMVILIATTLLNVVERRTYSSFES